MEGEKGVKVKSAGPGNAWLEGKTFPGAAPVLGILQQGLGMGIGALGKGSLGLRQNRPE